MRMVPQIVPFILGMAEEVHGIIDENLYFAKPDPQNPFFDYQDVPHSMSKFPIGSDTKTTIIYVVANKIRNSVILW